MNDNRSSPQESEQKARLTPEAPSRSSLHKLLSPQLFVATVLIYSGAGLFYFTWLGRDVALEALFRRFALPGLSLLLMLFGTYFLLQDISRRRAASEERFADVDARRRAANDPKDYEWLRAKIERLEATSGALSPDQIREITDALRQQKPSQNTSYLSSFRSYFDSLRTLLEEKSADSDEKASILLDKGTTYLTFGLVFFIISIIGWQVVAHLTGFQNQYIYGIVSCSVLFIFIEFLSAWFLRQYRLFVDTSTYLIKVKSLFDRYMLVYLIGEEASANGRDSKPSTAQLIELLRAKIDWPETYLAKEPDISFARETIETMSLLLKNMRGELSEKHTRTKNKGAEATETE